MRKLALTIHHERCLAELADIFKASDAKVDLTRAVLLIARLDNEELDVDAYRQEINRLARSVAATFPKDAKAQDKIKLLNKFLFKERGFHGSHSDYYSRSNSYLNEVLDDREGLPITLSVLYLELAPGSISRSSAWPCRAISSSAMNPPLGRPRSSTCSMASS